MTRGMLITFVALAIMFCTTFLFVANLRHVARDTAQTLRAVTTRSRQTGQLWPNLAFAGLWVLIFVTCYA